MARFTRLQVAQTMASNGMVPLYYHSDVALGKEILKACYLGGARLLEFTNRGDYAHEVFGELNKYCAKELPEMILGVGSVTDGGTASLYLQLGANFVVTPVLREDIAIVCNRKKVLWSPGCGSLTEICRAEELGCEIVKLFPGGTYGPEFVKAILGPQPWTSIMPTGGVSPTRESLKSWFDAGVTCVGMGSQLISKQVIKDRDFVGLEQQVREALQLIRELRN
ncbi:MAG TPA: bifunctional 4-hydroxy-2-oxoglutarate aldolase/2-dehydro-3-deoxy-phosphogluconate aldolase [Saprospiraceae bacterium]|nr:bifunctional 4-hydroxy-2-oxoglutarate aldolase/2-dehydro-3-deoxy-phosphogluconate aldolase [Saprospiraceae bacterium]MCB9268591.1 bifunctional 4-hydroxy-2-oxoglutarate aldolase/2-dehydro-3-deoxy-phosphogluconate aldolase [Lewinellaceae bacterium]HPG08590.1 bifunctional 4-hydroxy-2-oxoglutarate aldolase/2-dehydro-3-deoxy-phosphogluconate aldolase [Saprospiraceae bacterium]HPQ99572.1 bifunctional 4-hydroxy-2-oxoglutarate aldolase/2-dehydro-3-deoxy-phosphogluconate aldolase [Saprospiraceae bacte